MLVDEILNTLLPLLLAVICIALTILGTLIYTRKSYVGVSYVELLPRDAFLFFAFITIGMIVGVSLAKFSASIFGKENHLGIFLSTALFQIFSILMMISFPRLCKNKFKLFEKISFSHIRVGVVYFAISLLSILLLGFFIRNLVVMLTGEAPQEQDIVNLFVSINSPVLKALAIFSIVVFAPIAEELFMRGILYRIFSGAFLAFFNLKISKIISAVIVSIIFAVIHVNAFAFIPLFVMSLLLVASYEKSGNIISPIIVHSLFNTSNVIILTLMK